MRRMRNKKHSPSSLRLPLLPNADLSCSSMANKFSNVLPTENDLTQYQITKHILNSSYKGQLPDKQINS